MIALLILYLLLCLAAAFLGRGTRCGSFGTFLLSLLFTPFVTILFLFAFRRPPVTP